MGRVVRYEYGWYVCLCERVQPTAEQLGRVVRYGYASDVSGCERVQPKFIMLEYTRNNYCYRYVEEFSAANQQHYFGRVGVTYPSYVRESGTSGDNCFADTDQVCNPGHAVIGNICTPCGLNFVQPRKLRRTGPDGRMHCIYTNKWSAPNFRTTMLGQWELVNHGRSLS